MKIQWLKILNDWFIEYINESKEKENKAKQNSLNHAYISNGFNLHKSGWDIVIRTVDVWAW